MQEPKLKLLAIRKRAHLIQRDLPGRPIEHQFPKDHKESQSVTTSPFDSGKMSPSTKASIKALSSTLLSSQRHSSRPSKRSPLRYSQRRRSQRDLRDLVLCAKSSQSDLPLLLDTPMPAGEKICPRVQMPVPLVRSGKETPRCGQETYAAQPFPPSNYFIQLERLVSASLCKNVTMSQPNYDNGRLYRRVLQRKGWALLQREVIIAVAMRARAEAKMSPVSPGPSDRVPVT